MEEEEEEVQNQQLKQAAAVSKQQPPTWINRSRLQWQGRIESSTERSDFYMEPLVGCDSCNGACGSLGGGPRPASKMGSWNGRLESRRGTRPAIVATGHTRWAH